MKIKMKKTMIKAKEVMDGIYKNLRDSGHHIDAAVASLLAEDIAESIKTLNSIEFGLTLGAEAVEKLQKKVGDDRAAEIFGMSGSHVAEILHNATKEI